MNNVTENICALLGVIRKERQTEDSARKERITAEKELEIYLKKICPPYSVICDMIKKLEDDQNNSGISRIRESSIDFSRNRTAIDQLGKAKDEIRKWIVSDEFQRLIRD